MDVDWIHTTNIVRKQLRYLGIHQNDIDDVAQECLLRINNDLDKFTNADCNWNTFVYHQIQWAFLDFVRKRPKGISRKDRTIGNPFITNLEWSDRRESDRDHQQNTMHPQYLDDNIDEQRIEFVLRRLPKNNANGIRYSTVMTLWSKGLSQQDVAEILNICPSRVCQIIKQSLKCLREIEKETILMELT